MEIPDNSVAVRNENLSNRKRLWIVTVESIAVFIITYLIISILNNFISLSVARKFQITGELKYYGINWITESNSALWSFKSAISTFVSGPIFGLVLASILFVGLIISKRSYYLYRLFFVWGFLHCLVQFIGAYIAGVFSREGVWYASAWLGSKLIHEIILSIFFAMIAGFAGVYIFKMFLLSASSSFFLLSNMRKKYLRHQVVLPWFIGSIIIYGVKFQAISLYETLILSSYCFFFLSLVITESNSIIQYGRVRLYKKYYIRKVRIALPLLALLLLAIQRYWLR